MIILLLLAIWYMVWATKLGYRVMAYRSDWLDTDAPLNRTVKFIVCFFAGNFIGGFYLFGAMMKLIFDWMIH